MRLILCFTFHEVRADGFVSHKSPFSKNGCVVNHDHSIRLPNLLQQLLHTLNVIGQPRRNGRGRRRLRFVQHEKGRLLSTKVVVREVQGERRVDNCTAQRCVP